MFRSLLKILPCDFLELTKSEDERVYLAEKKAVHPIDFPARWAGAGGGMLSAEMEKVARFELKFI